MNKKNNHYIYLDYASTTPVDSRILERMTTFLRYEDKKFGNPSINYHAFGLNVCSEIEISRKQIANLINCKKEEIIFTSGATESNNLVIKGIADYYKKRGNHIITSLIEHPSILNSCKYLGKKGFEITYLKPEKNGLISLQELEKHININTILVTIHHVNHELGVIQDISGIGDICRKKDIIFHTDASQSIGKLDINVNDLNLKLLSFSGHKIYAPKGIGVLYVNSNINLYPQLHGGGQENNLRSGTLPVHQIIALGDACSYLYREKLIENRRLNILRDLFIRYIKEMKNIRINTYLKQSIPNIINLSFINVKKSFISSLLTKLIVSIGSACGSLSDNKYSPVLLSLGLDKELINNTIRVSFGRYTSKEDIINAIQYIYDTLFYRRFFFK